MPPFRLDKFTWLKPSQGWGLHEVMLKASCHSENQFLYLLSRFSLLVSLCVLSPAHLQINEEPLRELLFTLVSFFQNIALLVIFWLQEKLLHYVSFLGGGKKAYPFRQVAIRLLCKGKCVWVFSWNACAVYWLTGKEVDNRVRFRSSPLWIWKRNMILQYSIIDWWMIMISYHGWKVSLFPHFCSGLKGHVGFR